MHSKSACTMRNVLLESTISALYRSNNVGGLPSTTRRPAQALDTYCLRSSNGFLLSEPMYVPMASIAAAANSRGNLHAFSRLPHYAARRGSGSYCSRLPWPRQPNIHFSLSHTHTHNARVNTTAIAFKSILASSPTIPLQTITL